MDNLIMKRKEVEERFGKIGALVIASKNMDEPNADIIIYDYTRTRSVEEKERIQSKWWNTLRDVAEVWAPFYDTGEDLTVW